MPLHDGPVPAGAAHLAPLALHALAQVEPELMPPRFRVSSRMRRTLGTYNPERREITLSARLLAMGTLEEQRKVLLHELAHAIVFERDAKAAAHGRQFRQICRQIGADPSRFVEVAMHGWAKRTRYSFRCRSCGMTGLRKRRVRSVRCDCGELFSPRAWTVIALGPQGEQRIVAARSRRG